MSALHMRPCPQVALALVRAAATRREEERLLVVVAMAEAEVEVARRALPLVGVGAPVLVRARSLEAAGAAPIHRAPAERHRQWRQRQLGWLWLVVAQMLIQAATMAPLPRRPRLAVTCHSLLAARVQARDAASKLHRGW